MPFQQHHKNGHHQYTEGKGQCPHHSSCGRIIFASSLMATYFSAMGLYLCFCVLERESFCFMPWNAQILQRGSILTQAWPLGTLLLNFGVRGRVVELKGHLKKMKAAVLTGSERSSLASGVLLSTRPSVGSSWASSWGSHPEFLPGFLTLPSFRFFSVLPAHSFSVQGSQSELLLLTTNDPVQFSRIIRRGFAQSPGITYLLHRQLRDIHSPYESLLI